MGYRRDVRDIAWMGWWVSSHTLALVSTKIWKEYSVQIKNTKTWTVATAKISTPYTYISLMQVMVNTKEIFPFCKLNRLYNRECHIIDACAVVHLTMYLVCSKNLLCFLKNFSVLLSILRNNGKEQIMTMHEHTASAWKETPKQCEV